jgi:regulator of sigma E protease
MSIFSNFGLWGAGWTGWIIPFLFGLSVVVFFHELGHFLVARWCGVRVLTFSVGFGPEIVGFNDRYGTRWKLSWIPLGGYVKFFGDDNAASVPDESAVANMTEAEKRYSFFYQPVGRRAAIVAAGPIANFILAIVIFATIFAFYGRQTTTARVDTVLPDSAAAAAGLKPGDVVLAIDGRTIESFSDMQRVVSANAGRTLTFQIDRGGAPMTLTATPALKQSKDSFGNSTCQAKPSTSIHWRRSGSAPRKPGSSSTGRSPTSADCLLAANAPTNSAGRSGSLRYPVRSQRSVSCRCCIWRACCRCRSGC